MSVDDRISLFTENELGSKTGDDGDTGENAIGDKNSVCDVIGDVGWIAAKCSGSNTRRLFCFVCNPLLTVSASRSDRTT